MTTKGTKNTSRDGDEPEEKSHRANVPSYYDPNNIITKALYGMSNARYSPNGRTYNKELTKRGPGRSRKRMTE